MLLVFKHNGPAVEGVNVGGVVRRYESRYFSQKIVPAASHNDAIFASPATDEFVSVAVFVQSRSHESGR
jgi:hypothetical protein